MDKCKKCGRPVKNDTLNKKGLCTQCQSIKAEPGVTDAGEKTGMFMGIVGVLLAIWGVLKPRNNNNT